MTPFFRFGHLGPMAICPGARAKDAEQHDGVPRLAGSLNTMLYNALRAETFSWAPATEDDPPIEELSAEKKEALEKVRAIVEPFLGANRKLAPMSPMKLDTIAADTPHAILWTDTRALLIADSTIHDIVAEDPRNVASNLAWVKSAFDVLPHDTLELLVIAGPGTPSGWMWNHITYQRDVDYQHATRTLGELFNACEKPDRTLQAGAHCELCRWAGDCPATLGPLKRMVTKIDPTIVPATFNAAHISTAEDMAILRHWVSVVEAACSGIKSRAVDYVRNVQNGEPLEYRVGGRVIVSYELMHFDKRVKPVDGPLLWEKVKAWLPLERFMVACPPNLNRLLDEVVAVMESRIMSRGQVPNKTAIRKDFLDYLKRHNLLTDGTGEKAVLWPVRKVDKKKRKR